MIWNLKFKLACKILNILLCFLRRRSPSPGKGFDNTYTTTTGGKGTPIPTTGSPDRNRSLSPSYRRAESPT